MLWIIKILFINAIILFVILSNTAYSQNDSKLRNSTIQSNLIGWDTIITIIGATGLISAVGSGLFNIYITNRQLKGQLANKYKELNQQHHDKLSELDKQHTDNLKHLGAQLEKTIEQMKYERQLNEIQDKLNIYASFAFDLKKLRGLRHNYPVPPQNKIDEISKDIDLLIRPKFYLLSPNIINGWLEVNRDYTNLAAIDNLFNELSIEYNNNILNEYHVITGLELPQLVD